MKTHQTQTLIYGGIGALVAGLLIFADYSNASMLAGVLYAGIAGVMTLVGFYQLHIAFAVLKGGDIPYNDKKIEKGSLYYYLAILSGLCFGTALPMAGLYILYLVWKGQAIG